jgi:hypothetical protein
METSKERRVIAYSNFKLVEKIEKQKDVILGMQEEEYKIRHYLAETYPISDTEDLTTFEKVKETIDAMLIEVGKAHVKLKKKKKESIWHRPIRIRFRRKK